MPLASAAAHLLRPTGTCAFRHGLEAVLAISDVSEIVPPFRSLEGRQLGGFERLIEMVKPGEPNDLVVTKRPHMELRLRHAHATLAPFGPENDRREHSLMSVAKAPDLVRERAEPVADRAADCSKPTSPPTPAGIDRPRRAHELCIIGEQLAETGNVVMVPSLVEGANRRDVPSRQGRVLLLAKGKPPCPLSMRWR
jgi:hypothetical protein